MTEGITSIYILKESGWGYDILLQTDKNNFKITQEWMSKTYFFQQQIMWVYLICWVILVPSTKYCKYDQNIQKKPLHFCSMFFNLLRPQFNDQFQLFQVNNIRVKFTHMEILFSLVFKSTAVKSSIKQELHSISLEEYGTYEWKYTWKGDGTTVSTDIQTDSYWHCQSTYSVFLNNTDEHLKLAGGFQVYKWLTNFIFEWPCIFD